MDAVQFLCLAFTDETKSWRVFAKHMSGLHRSLPFCHFSDIGDPRVVYKVIFFISSEWCPREIVIENIRLRLFSILPFFAREIRCSTLRLLCKTGRWQVQMQLAFLQAFLQSITFLTVFHLQLPARVTFTSRNDIGEAFKGILLPNLQRLTL